MSPKVQRISLLIALISLCAVAFFIVRLAPPVSSIAASMSVTHVVLFQFKKGVPPETVRDGGMTHAFVVNFASKEDRDYYVQKDPLHQEFVRSAGEVLEKAQVVDFTNGEL
ncbi:stress responsive A/B barrel domain-containing protein [Microsporum canis CBS 113480]|uniref:Stress responsive A/B barrel domain-containing protein n=1 Tax=Arthroderma otae (strain ATCC MYA-4605 / CBS 113480) TaxID=554155 RepID=C5FP52_ARTOC|nr:stress responsive A/B barrel domain-containing protein [Microsporum canis CBS 113480]EEQ31368.1 stress responsive A/B barrel domain-containing protein [Microsporum canis CBS 113480]